MGTSRKLYSQERTFRTNDAKEMISSKVAFALHGLSVTILGIAGISLLLCLGTLKTIITALDLKDTSMAKRWSRVGDEEYVPVVLSGTMVSGIISVLWKRGRSLHMCASCLYIGWCFSSPFSTFLLLPSENRTLPLCLTSIVTASFGMACAITNITRYWWIKTRGESNSKTYIPTRCTTGLPNVRQFTTHMKIPKSQVFLSTDSIFEKNRDASKNLTRSMERYLDIVDEIEERNDKIRPKSKENCGLGINSAWNLRPTYSVESISRSQSHDCLFDV